MVREKIANGIFVWAIRRLDLKNPMLEPPMDDHPPRPSTALPETVQRLVGEAADKNTAKLNPVVFDPGQSRMSRPPHWPAVTCLDPGDYCTARYMVVDFLGQGGSGRCSRCATCSPRSTRR